MFTSLIDQWWRTCDWWLSLWSGRSADQAQARAALLRQQTAVAPPEADGSSRPPAEPAETPSAVAGAAERASTADPSPEQQDAELAAEDDEEALDDEDEEEGLEATPLPDDVLQAQLREARAAARETALAGPHRVLLSMPAGPGSLPEALKLLEEAGRVESTFVDDAELGPHLLYVPVVHAG